MDVTAKLRNLRIAPRKVRLVADLVRGRSVIWALAQLQFENKRAAEPVRQLIKSAVANAENNFKLKTNDFIIKMIAVNDAPTMKRHRARAFGRAAVIQKRGSHVTLVVGLKNEIVLKKEKGEVKKIENKEPKKDVKKATVKTKLKDKGSKTSLAKKK